MEPATSMRGVGETPLLETTLAAMHEARMLTRYHWVAPLVRGRRVLDAGCGAGRGAAILVRQGAAEVVAVDETAAVVEVARSEVPPGVHLHRANLGRLPFPEAAFDVAVSLGARPVSGMDLVSELLRVVKPGGILVVSADAEAIRSVSGLLAEHRSHVAIADQRDLAGSSVDRDTGPGDRTGDRVVRGGAILGDHQPSAAPQSPALLMASDLPLPTPDPVAVAFDLGGADEWLRYSTEQERQIRELGTTIRELERKLDDRNRLRSELRVTEQALGKRVATYEEGVQYASLRTAAGYRDTVSWKVSYPLRRSSANAKRLVRRLLSR